MVLISNNSFQKWVIYIFTNRITHIILLNRGRFSRGATRTLPTFGNHFEELELIINYAPLTPNHFLFGRQLLYSSNTAATVVKNVTIFSSTTDKINCISNHFWDRWRYEYV